MSGRVERDEFVSWARSVALPMMGGGPELAPPGDVAACLAERLGAARVVGIGESWHSAHELLVLRHRLIRLLVEQFGFNGIVFEGSLHGSGVVDSFVSGGAERAEDALRALGRPMWLNDESEELLVWVRGLNAGRSGESRVRVLGLDCVSPAGGIAAVLGYFGRVDPGYDFPEREAVEEIGRGFGAVPFNSQSPSAVWGSTAFFDGLSERLKRALHGSFVEAVAQLQLERDTYVARSSEIEFEWALRHALGVLQAERVLGINTRSRAGAQALRDHAFAENVMWILRMMPPGSRIVIVAHNLHIAKQPFRTVGPSSPSPDIDSMGVYLRDWLGVGYAAVGSAVGLGRVSGLGPGLVADNPDASPDAEAYLPGSLDAALEELNLEQFLLPLPREDPPAWLRTRLPLRSHRNPPEYEPARAFDLIAYVDRIQAAAAFPA